MPGLAKQWMSVLRTGIKSYLCVDRIFKVRRLLGFSFEDVPFCALNEKGEMDGFQ